MHQKGTIDALGFMELGFLASLQLVLKDHYFLFKFVVFLPQNIAFYKGRLWLIFEPFHFNSISVTNVSWLPCDLCQIEIVKLTHEILSVREI